jgi:hypothetical protein
MLTKHCPADHWTVLDDIYGLLSRRFNGQRSGEICAHKSEPGQQLFQLGVNLVPLLKRKATK